MFDLLVAALALGFVGSLHCAGMCGPLISVCAGRPLAVAGWQIGKLGSYAALGAVAGALGSQLPGPPFLVSILGALVLVGFGMSALGWLPEPPIAPGLVRAGSRLAGSSGAMARVGFGALSGLLPCGLVYAALGLAVATGGAPGGALVMVGFGLGTAPLLTTVGLAVRPLAARPSTRRALAVASMLTGLVVLARRSGLNPFAL